MNSRWLLSVALLLLSLSVQACADDSQGCLFQWSYAPSRTYATNVFIQSSNHLMLEGKSEAAKEKLKQTAFPIQIESSQTTRIIITTDEADQQGNIPFVSKVIENTTSNTVGGKKLAPTQQAALEDAVFTGLIDQKTKRMNILSVKGKDLTPQAESMIRKALDDALNQLQFPSSPVKIGHTFAQRLKLQVPVPGLQPVDMFAVVKYTLRKIEVPVAFFDIMTDLELATKNSEMHIAVEGGGSGSMRFDMENRLPMDYVTSENMRLTIDAPEVRVTVKSNSNTRMEYTAR
ncbi:MAG: hypothetical protein H6Q52_3297 [Deltaproteobacteria bacterium]|nr:hypothetical protein [Deltaproteobacteria bacterium]